MKLVVKRKEFFALKMKLLLLKSSFFDRYLRNSQLSESVSQSTKYRLIDFQEEIKQFFFQLRCEAEKSRK